MIPVKRVDHISMAARSWRDQAALLERLVGFRLDHSFEPNESEPYSGALLGVPGTGIGFEILEPADERSFVQRFLDTRGPGIHHVTMEVHDIREAVRELEADGIEPFGGVQDDGVGWIQTFIHPRDGGGLLWQLFQPYGAEKAIPDPGPGGAAGLVRVDHLSLVAADLDERMGWHKRLFGMTELSRFTSEEQGFEARTLSFPGSRLILEVMAPLRGDSFAGRFLAERGPGAHHICCEVRSVEAAVVGLKSEGIEAFGGVIEGPDWKRHTFLHPKDSGGVLFQLFEER
ncbi:MAG TPA: VOC family protein [Tepidiformaceae bacterium]|nr:VOC family protein [Tepidiformaceae bacterium]